MCNKDSSLCGWSRRLMEYCYVCMYACIHVCMCVCMYVCMHVFMYVCVCMYVCMYVCCWSKRSMKYCFQVCFVCMYVCIYVCIDLATDHDRQRTQTLFENIMAPYMHAYKTYICHMLFSFAWPSYRSWQTEAANAVKHHTFLHMSCALLMCRTWLQIMTNRGSKCC